MKSLSIYFLLLGIVWAVLVGWMHLAPGGIAEPISMMRVVLYFGGMLIGPLILVAVSFLVLNGTYAKPGALLALLGCAVLC